MDKIKLKFTEINIQSTNLNIRALTKEDSSKLFSLYSDTEVQQFTDIEILDLSGKVLKKFKAGKEQYDLKLPNGIYIIKLINGSSTIKTGKILIDN